MDHSITQTELNTATRMAKRKTGVTRVQLAERLDIVVSRAVQILNKIGAKGKIPVKPIKGANRTKVFNLAA